MTPGFVGQGQGEEGAGGRMGVRITGLIQGKRGKDKINTAKAVRSRKKMPSMWVQVV